jgi:hypothetical protein
MRSPSQQDRHLAHAINCTLVDVTDRNAFFIFFLAPKDRMYELKIN